MYTGHGSHAQHDDATYRLAPNSRTRGTTLTIEADSSGGWVPASLGQLLWPLLWPLARKCLAHPSQ